MSDLNCAQRFDYHALGSSRKLGGVADSEKRICLLSFEFQSPHVIERRSKYGVSILLPNRILFLFNKLLSVRV